MRLAKALNDIQLPELAEKMKSLVSSYKSDEREKREKRVSDLCPSLTVRVTHTGIASTIKMKSNVNGKNRFVIVEPKTIKYDTSWQARHKYALNMGFVAAMMSTGNGGEDAMSVLSLLDLGGEGTVVPRMAHSGEQGARWRCRKS